MGLPRVLQRIGQRLLDDPERRQVDADGSCGSPTTSNSTSRPASRTWAISSEVGDPRLRREEVGGVGAQDAEQPAHVGQGTPPDVLDGQQDLACRAATDRARRSAPACTTIMDTL